MSDQDHKQPETEEQKKEREAREKEEHKKAVEEAAKKGYGTIHTDKEKYNATSSEEGKPDSPTNLKTNLD